MKLAEQTDVRLRDARDILEQVCDSVAGFGQLALGQGLPNSTIQGLQRLF